MNAKRPMFLTALIGAAHALTGGMFRQNLKKSEATYEPGPMRAKAPDTPVGTKPRRVAVGMVGNGRQHVHRGGIYEGQWR